MTTFRFAFVESFLLFIPLLLLVLWWLTGIGRRNAAVMQYSDTRLLGGLPVSTRMRLRRLPDFLRLVVLACLIVALARPQSGSRDDKIIGEGIDIVIALDISNSMAEADINALTRLDAAKSVIRDFILGRAFDSIGLIVFGEDAFYQSPPTLDYTSLVRILENVPLAAELNLGNRTAIGMGLAASVSMIRESEAKSKVIILLTDGVNNAGEIDPYTAAQTAVTFGIRVYTVGINTSDPTYPNSLAERTLREVAELTGGRYYNASTLAGLQGIYDEIDLLEGTEIELEIKIVWLDQGFPIIGLALALLLIERYLRQSVFQTIP